MSRSMQCGINVMEKRKSATSIGLDPVYPSSFPYSITSTLWALMRGPGYILEGRLEETV